MGRLESRCPLSEDRFKDRLRKERARWPSSPETQFPPREDPTGQTRGAFPSGAALLKNGVSFNRVLPSPLLKKKKRLL